MRAAFSGIALRLDWAAVRCTACQSFHYLPVLMNS